MLLQQCLEPSAVNSLEDILARLRPYIVKSYLFGEASLLPPDDASLHNRGLIDSTSVLDLVLFVEAEFGLTVGDDDLSPRNFDSIRGLAEFVTSKVGVS